MESLHGEREKTTENLRENVRTRGEGEEGLVRVEVEQVLPHELPCFHDGGNHEDTKSTAHKLRVEKHDWHDEDNQRNEQNGVVHGAEDLPKGRNAWQIETRAPQR